MAQKRIATRPAPGVEAPQGTEGVRLSLVDDSTGKRIATMRVRPQNVRASMPIKPGTHVAVTRVDADGKVLSRARFNKGGRHQLDDIVPRKRRKSDSGDSDTDPDKKKGKGTGRGRLAAALAAHLGLDERDAELLDRADTRIGERPPRIGRPIRISKPTRI